MRFARFAAVALSPFTLALVVSACSDPVPPTPQGAWSLAFVDTGEDCPIAGHNAQVGSVSSNKKDSVLIDGQTEGGDTVSVSCSVIGTNTFKVEANARHQGSLLQIRIPSISKAATEAEPVVGTVGYSSVETANAYQSPECQFYFTDDTPQSVAAGRIWVAFKCPTIKSDKWSCEIQQGYAIFENCLQSEIEEE